MPVESLRTDYKPFARIRRRFSHHEQQLNDNQAINDPELAKDNNNIRSPHKPLPQEENDYFHHNHQHPHYHSSNPILSFFSYLFEWAEEMFIKFIPYDEFREYPPKFMYFSGFVLFCIIGCFFGGLFGYLYLTNLNTVFLAPINGVDSTSVCQEILSPVTGKFLGTEKGIWEGSEGFQFSEATYVITASNWRLPQKRYAYLMGELYQGLSIMGNLSSSSDLGMNLIVWFSFTGIPDLFNPVNRFYFTGDPSVALAKQIVFGTLSSVAGECHLPNQYATFDKANGKLILSMPYNEYINNTKCMAAADPFILGYNPFATVNNFELNIDVYALVTAIAVNLGILPFPVLVEIAAKRANLQFTGKSFVLSEFYNPKFYGMTPILCLVNATCGLRIGPSIIAIPFFHHLGMDFNSPKRCICNTIDSNDLLSPQHPCNLFNFLAGIVFYADTNMTSVGEFISRAPFGFLLAKSYEPSFVASAFGEQSPNYAQFNSIASRKKLYQFCTVKHGTCSMLTFTLTDGIRPDWAISDFYYQLTNGACRDTFSVPQPTW